MAPTRPSARALPGAAFLLVPLVLLLLAACAAPPRHTPHSAGALAARLANDRCQERYGARPFAPSDFAAEWQGGRWRWGGEDAQPVDGYSATVSFAPDGSAREVDVDRQEHRGNPDGL